MRYALIVGVQEYEPDSGISSVKFASRDAYGIGQALQDACGFDCVRILADQEDDVFGQHRVGMPTDASILEELGHAADRLEEEDLFLFFFAGHGIERPVDGVIRTLMLARNACPQWHKGVVDLGVLHARLSNIRAGERVVLLDCCRDNPEAVRGGCDNRLGRKLFMDITAASSRVETAKRTTIIMTACWPGQRAWPWGEKRHGVFSYFILEGLNGAAWRSGALDAMDLCRYVERSVAEWATTWGRIQRPYFQQLESTQAITLAGEQDRTLGDNRIVLVDDTERVRCPLCGVSNKADRTFRCTACGMEHLCLRHLDRRHDCCRKCAVAARAEAKLERWKGLMPGQSWLIPEIAMRLSWIGPGAFMMAANPKNHPARGEGHFAEINYDYWLGIYPVTQRDYRFLMKDNPSTFSGERNPVEGVTWDQARMFCARLTEQEEHAGRLPEGYAYRIPTETEWEYAAKGGPRSGKYSYSGSDVLDEVGWGADSPPEGTKPVGGKKPNELGIYDMSGNVWEWCLDAYGPNKTDLRRVCRGGSWHDDPENCTTFARTAFVASFKHYYIGFRCCLGPKISML